MMTTGIKRTKGELAELIRHLEGDCQAFAYEIRAARTARDYPEAIERSIAHTRKSIDSLQRQLAASLHLLECADQIIEENKAKVVAKRQQIVLLQNEKKIAELLELQSQLNSECGDEETPGHLDGVAAMLEDETNEEGEAEDEEAGCWPESRAEDD